MRKKDEQMDVIKKRLENIGPEYRCDVRWWLAEALHTDETLIKEVRTLAEDGYGAAEFLAIDDLDADSARYGWGSEEWVHDTEVIIRELTKHGLGASMTSGTNWSNANLPDTVHMPDDPSSSKELSFVAESLKLGESRSGALQKPEIRKPNVSKHELIAVISAKKAGEENDKILLENPQVIEVTSENFIWTAPTDGEYILFTFWMHGTGQTANPSVSTSYTVNYIDRYGIDKLIDYWNNVVLTHQLRGYIKENGGIQMYMDSLELSTYGNGGLLWGYNLIDEFRKRRGFDLKPYLPFILRKVHGFAMGPINYLYEMTDSEKITKIRNDFYQTMTDLYIENMLKPMQEWLHSVGMTLRAEISYGVTFEISQPGKYVDGIETESFEFASQIDSYRGLAGAAHLYNKVYSSETGANVMNYQLGLDFYSQIIFTQFAAGVTKTVLHGFTSIRGSEGDTDWPGHEGMWPTISERFDERQPYYRFIKDWTAMIARFQRLLRSGKPRRDVAVLRLDYNYWNTLLAIGMMTGRSEKEIYETALMRANEGIYWKDTAMQNAGYSYDYFAPQLLEDPDAGFRNAGYKAVVLYQEELPLDSAKTILNYAKQGLPVILANGITETVQMFTDKSHKKAAVRTPFNDGKDCELAAVIAELKNLSNVREINNPSEITQALINLGVKPYAGFTEPNSKILTLLREEDNWHFLYLYHYMYTDSDAFTVTVRIKGESTPYSVDCWTGNITVFNHYDFKDGHTFVTVTLRPGEAMMLAFDKNMAVPNVQKSLCLQQEIPLPKWNLTVESWSKGEKREVTEDRGLGYVTKEIYFETEKNLIPVGETTLKSWKDITEIGPSVSGIGTYETAFVLPTDWDETHTAVFEIDSTSGNAAGVFVNGKKVILNFNRRTVDITAFLHHGENMLRVEVASTLSNQLLSTGFYEMAYPKTAKLMQIAMGHEITFNSEEGEAARPPRPMPPIYDYGMTGEARIKIYKTV